ncbi:leucine--tRNA ligase CDC60 [Sporobolomyces koalae]|uniref:leucine--tRNA ligase CDC60 n=1 Tax=Sporobolomyces koalae TaxID=500713 RepID=UPI00317FF5C7
MAAAPAAADKTAPPAQNTAKRDFLIQLEQDAQKRWAAEKLFEQNSPYQTGDAAVPTEGFAQHAAELREKYPKVLATMPYPYMNGSLHLGHGFSISKIEFLTGFERMRGKRALWPFGFHATGMPIKAASDKLIREMEMFGQDFENYGKDEPAAEVVPTDEPGNATALATTSTTTSSDPAKAKKGKLAAKSTGLQYQFQIMESIGVKRDEIKQFADPLHWLKYFPPIAQEDLNSLGSRIDWRRSFITTPANPYYDAFVRWQMNKLHGLGYIKFGKRNTIFSPKDGQPCMDHDRQSGEGVGPQEYMGMKLEVTHFGDRAARVKELVAGRKVYMVAATLRSETMYGITNLFVNPKLTYGLYPSSSTKGSDSEVLYLVHERAARNLAYQGFLKEDDKYECVGTVSGAELLGSKVHHPIAVIPEVFVVPMDTIKENKGTAVVVCMTSDSPDDYVTWLDLRKKPEFYNIEPEWVANEPVRTLTTPTYGDMTAKTLVEKMKINSPKDVKQLAEAKELAYKEGFYSGVMVIGEYAGEKVEDCKVKIKDDLVRANKCIVYSEPENTVMSRSGDECVVALCDQWYLDYGEAGWLKKAELLLARMNTYQDETRNGFEGALGWLRQWACARSYGLGSKLPWDPQFLVESLSDSTIYMAYYTIAHMLHGPPIDGSVVGPLGITAEQMTDEMFEYVFANGPYPSHAPISQDKLNILKSEFSYFYPMDIRSSGKDLIPNHLTFCIYVHAALFAEEHWPRSMRANGHLMLNGEKMSKSTGNSLTLRDSLQKFGADATRVTLADAGDSIEDANFEESTANAAILRLRTLVEWCEENEKNQGQLRRGDANLLWDKIFENEINEAIEQSYNAYDKAMYKDALKTGFYQLLSARDLYQVATSAEGGMHVDLVMRFIKVQALLITPIAPHVAEYIWSTILKEKSSIQTALYPTVSAPVDPSITDAATYVRTKVKDIRDSELAFAKKKAKGKGSASFDPSKPKAVKIWVAQGFPEWQEVAVEIVKGAWTGDKVDDKKVKEDLTAKGLIKEKKYMPFIAQLKKRIALIGFEGAINRQVLFSEEDVLREAMPYFRRTLSIDNIEVASTGSAPQGGEAPGYVQPIVEAAEPGSPGIVLYNVEA